MIWQWQATRGGSFDGYFTALQDLGVRSYDQFLDYLQAKLPAGEIGRVSMPFDGRNTALWWPGPATEDEPGVS